jgi:hypothetical protein
MRARAYAVIDRECPPDCDLHHPVLDEVDRVVDDAYLRAEDLGELRRALECYVAVYREHFAAHRGAVGASA